MGSDHPAAARPAPVAWLVLALACAAAPPPRPAAAQLVRTVGRILATGGVSGRFADPVCTDDLSLAPAPFAAAATALATARGQSDRPFLVDAGGLVSPHGVSRWTARHAPTTLADLVEQLGYVALALGALDLGAPREPLVDVARALRARGIPMLATNLRCTAAAASLCEVVVDGSDGLSVHRFGDRSLAVVSILPPGVARLVSPERMAGLRLADPAETIARAVRRALEDDLFVVATIDLTGSADPTSEALALVRALPPEDRPHLLVVNGAGDELAFARPPEFRPALVAPPREGVLLVRVREDLLEGTFDFLARPERPDDHPALPILEWIDRVGPDYCRALGASLPGGRLETPLDAAGLLALTAGTARRATGAEVALLRERVVEASWRPARDVLTASDVYVGLRADEPLVRARVTPAWLRRVAERADPRLFALGLTLADGVLQVNGRAAEPRGDYAVVTTQFLARGGLGLLPEGPEWRPAGTTLREALRAHLDVPRARDPRAALPSPADGVEWEVSVIVDATFDATRATNPEGRYTASLLAGADNLNVGGRLRLGFDAVHPEWSWENDVDVRYTVNETASVTTNPTDLVQWTSAGVWRGLREARSPPWVPELYVDNLFETEITTPAQDDPGADPPARDFTRLFTRPSAGLRFPLARVLDLKTGFSVQVERVRRGEAGGDGRLAAEVSPGFNGQLVLSPWTLLEDGGRAVRLGFRLDANVSEWLDTSRRSTQLRGTADLVLTLGGPFALTLTYDLFAQKDARFDWGLYTRGLVSLTVAWLGRGVAW